MSEDSNPVIDAEKLSRWMRGDELAVLFCQQFLQMVHTWDDLIDKDVKRSDSDINQAFYHNIGEWRHNPFFKKWGSELYPVITAAVHDWFTSNVLQASKDRQDWEIAYTLRCNVLSVITHCAYCVGGGAWVQEIGPEIRRYGQRQTLEDYIGERQCQV